MKKNLHTFFAFVLLLIGHQAFTQCDAEFAWEQLPGTLTIHFNNNSTSEHDIVSNVWHFGDGQNGDGENPNHTYAQPGTYNVCLIITDSEGCVADVCHMVVVAPLGGGECDAEFAWEQIPGTLTIHFNNNSTSEHDIVSNIWHFGDGHNGDGENPNHTYDQPGTYNVCLIITDSEGCVADVCHMVVVAPIGGGDCEAAFTWDQGSGLAVHFFDQSDDDPDIVSWHWTFGDGGISDHPDPVHTYDEPGVYLVCLIVENEFGCVSDVCHEVVVEGGGGGDCEAAFTWEQGNGLIVHFIDQSDDDPDIISWLWNFGDGHMGDGQNPVHEYAHPGVYLVCLIVTNEFGCVADVCHEVVVEGSGGVDCSAAFEWEQGNGLIMHFIDHSDDDPDIISWHWTFGDGHDSHEQNPVHEYAESGVYLVCIRVENEFGCVAELCHEVHVEGNGGGDCSAAFEWEQGNNLVVHFIDHSDDDPDIVSWHWSFGDGHFSDDQNPVHEYAEPGVYTVCLLVTNEFGCVADICHQVTVHGPGGDCSAAFVWDQGPGLVVHFIDHSDDDPDIVSWHWTFGDGHDSNDQNPVHEYAHPGVYVVCIRVENELGCVAELCHEVHVEGTGEECNAAFTWETGNGYIIHFIDQSDDDPDIVSWHWIFGDGHTGDGQNPVHEYDQPGVYVVCLIVTNEFGCVSDVCHDLIIQGPEECEALFNFEYSENGEIVFFNNNSTGDSPHTSWLWNFGDGHSSTEENPHHNYEEPGIYTVCLTMTDSVTECYDDICIDLVYELGYEEINNNSSIETFRSSFDPPTKINEDVIIVRYTNPASHNLSINYYVGKPTTVSFTLSDMNGKHILAQDFGNSIRGNHQREVYLGNIPAGLYMIKLIMNEEAETRVLVITQ